MEDFNEEVLRRVTEHNKTINKMVNNIKEHKDNNKMDSCNDCIDDLYEKINDDKFIKTLTTLLKK